MPRIEVDIPDRLTTEIDQLAEGDEFLDRADAVEELLARGISAYDVEETTTREDEEDLFDRASEQQDPAALDDEGNDEPTF